MRNYVKIVQCTEWNKFALPACFRFAYLSYHLKTSSEYFHKKLHLPRHLGLIEVKCLCYVMLCSYFTL